MTFYTREGFIKLGFYVVSFLVYLYKYVRPSLHSSFPPSIPLSLSLSLSPPLTIPYSTPQHDGCLGNGTHLKYCSPDKVSGNLSLLLQDSTM